MKYLETETFGIVNDIYEHPNKIKIVTDKFLIEVTTEGEFIYEKLININNHKLAYINTEGVKTDFSSFNRESFKKKLTRKMFAQKIFLEFITFTGEEKDLDFECISLKEESKIEIKIYPV